MMDWLKALPNWQPYGDPQYFGYLVLALVPIVIAMLYGKRIKWYEGLVSLAFIVLMFDTLATVYRIDWLHYLANGDGVWLCSVSQASR